MATKKLEELFQTPRQQSEKLLHTATLDGEAAAASTGETISKNETSSSSPGHIIKMNSEEKDDIIASISKVDGITLLHFLWDTCEGIPYKTKKEFNKDMGFNKVPTTPDIIKFLVKRMEDILTCKFLKVDRSIELLPRDIENRSWNHVSAIQRSSDGTVGIFMIQSKYHHHQNTTSDIIVAKPYTQSEYNHQVFVNQLITFLKISCPKIRSIERQSEEWKELKAAVDKFYIEPFHEGLYENGGRASPKPLFDSSLIMLMEYASGQPLQHKVHGQRPLTPTDYHAIGQLFLFDLLIRNTDRLPCRKTIPRTVAGGAVADQGNSGNIMLGVSESGQLCAIDNEMQLSIGPEQKEEYLLSFESVVTELLHRHHKAAHYKHVVALFFEPVTALQGILDVSLERLSPWRSASASPSPYETAQSQAVSAILQLIRVRASVDHKCFFKPPPAPPTTDEEKEWREWIRLNTPRTLADIMEFIEASSVGYTVTESAWESFEAGFEQCVDSVVERRAEFRQSLILSGSLSSPLPSSLKTTTGAASDEAGRDSLCAATTAGSGGSEEAITFILRLIDDSLTPIYETYQNRHKKAKQNWGNLKTNMSNMSLLVSGRTSTSIN